jgi:HD-GYP domain-containing protein (c-di-GMP phosphodiesterase class II)
MNKVLVISDNEFVNLLYVMNLEVYLNSQVTLINSVPAAIEMLKKVPFDLILALNIVDKKDTKKLIKEFFTGYGKKIPLIITGVSEDETLWENILGVPSKFNIQSILKAAAKMLGITAKKMSELNVGAFYPVSIVPLLSLSKAPCKIYQNPTASKVLVHQDDPMDDNALRDLAQTGVQQVYVSSGDRLVIANKISLTLIEKITSSINNLGDAPVENKVQALSDGYDFAAANLFSSDEIKQQMQEIATASAKVMADVAKDSRTIQSLLDILMSNKEGYVFTHSMITSYVVYHMIKNFTWGGEGQVEKINFVLFFHDIFLAPIYMKYPEIGNETNLLNSDKLEFNEIEIVMNHAQLAAELVVGYKRCPMGSDLLIKQHHGMKKGKGFVKIYAEDLSPLAKILLIAENFVEEFMKAREENKEFSLQDVIPKLINEFSLPSYAKMVKTLVHVRL